MEKSTQPMLLDCNEDLVKTESDHKQVLDQEELLADTEAVVGKGGFWDNSPYTWFNYIQINHTCGWNTNIIRVPTTCMVRHNLEFTE